MTQEEELENAIYDAQTQILDAQMMDMRSWEFDYEEFYPHDEAVYQCLELLGYNVDGRLVSW